ncbi:hypothetical protein HOLleu_20344 [Holothuria leucospilota]|uniref:Uncharacterized protein n=1 Tax=Holothuria leucospilota TaxID=206669 RepID=A0A9Q1H7Y1_HOLLE|nr:hypothetical protein HOLleu_20344 [Holothuria leucospilota]
MQQLYNMIKDSVSGYAVLHTSYRFMKTNVNHNQRLLYCATNHLCIYALAILRLRL